MLNMPSAGASLKAHGVSDISVNSNLFLTAAPNRSVHLSDTALACSTLKGSDLVTLS